MRLMIRKCRFSNIPALKAVGPSSLAPAVTAIDYHTVAVARRLDDIAPCRQRKSRLVAGLFRAVTPWEAALMESVPGPLASSAGDFAGSPLTDGKPDSIPVASVSGRWRAVPTQLNGSGCARQRRAAPQGPPPTPPDGRAPGRSAAGRRFRALFWRWPLRLERRRERSGERRWPNLESEQSCLDSPYLAGRLRLNGQPSWRRPDPRICRLSCYCAAASVHRLLPGLSTTSGSVEVRIHNFGVDANAECLGSRGMARRRGLP